MALTGVGVALVFMGVEQGKPLYTVGGVALALLCLVVTFMVIDGDRREKYAAEAGAARAQRFWQPAHYCRDCNSVFCPGEAPWRGVLTPEQFKKLVWTEAGYADQLVPGDKAKDAELPSGVLAERRQGSAGV